MKTIKLLLLAIGTFLLFFAGCFVNITMDQPTVNPGDSSVFKMISIAVLAVYEVVVRIVPSIGDYSVISWIIKALKKVSDTLNVKP